MTSPTSRTNRARGGKVGASPVPAGEAPAASAEEPDLPLPHERDEADNVTNPAPDKRIEQAKRDLDAGLVDTDLHSTPGLDAERQRELLQEELLQKPDR